MWDETTFCVYGTPLPVIERDAVPAKRQAVRPEDQIVTDENGKRRFHGAFTGGFSAGYWNTVGSQEGWTPQSFKSSRAEKAPQRQQQRPEDFMDAEDRGEFGIAPKTVQVRPEFANEATNDIASTGEGNARKRKLLNPSVGAIPGQPVLCQLLKKPEVENVAVRILKLWGWRTGRGVGPRQTLKEKKLARERNKREMYILERYGCDASAQERKPIGYDDSDGEQSGDSSQDEEAEDGITYAPEDFEPLPAINENRYGLGFTPLSRESVLSQDLTAKPRSRPQVFELLNKNNTKFSITGQAFGVGALEDDDDMEVYQGDDWAKYDFSLEDEQKKRKDKMPKAVRDTTVLEGFVAAKENFIYKPTVFKVDIPIDFRPRNWGERRSRFAPLDVRQARHLESNLKKGDTELTPALRGRILGEQQAPTAATNEEEGPTTSAKAQEREAIKMRVERTQDVQKGLMEKTKALLEQISAKSSNFTHGGIITAEGEEQNAALDKERKDVLQQAQNKTKHLPSVASSGSFKPFLGNDAKQQRYDDFLAANLTNDEEITSFLRTIQPVELSEWDREMEKKEFIQARSIYKPLGGIMSDRFVTAGAAAEEKTVVLDAPKVADNKIIMQRTKNMWKPCALLCKRYNIAEPFGGALQEEKKPQRSKLSVFDYLETSLNRKADFQTPVIIPKHIEKPQPIIRAATHIPPLKLEPDITAKETVTEAPIVAATVSTVDPVEPKSKGVQPKGFVARTDIQKRVVETLDQPASEKFELFKAIFDNDSDEEETDNADQKQEQQAAEESAKAAVNAAFVADLMQPKSAAAANLLRNTSPPRGIFAALFKAPEPKAVEAQPLQSEKSMETVEPLPVKATPKITFKPRSERMGDAALDLKEQEEKASEATSTTTVNAEDVYGPKVPERLEPVSEVELQIYRLLDKHRHSATKDRWVEKHLSAEGSSEDSESDSTNSSDETSKVRKKKTRKSKKQKSKERAKKEAKKKQKKSKRKKGHKVKKKKYL